MQKTDFAYEILLHDDASTDNSAEILREYEAKYPDVVKPIYQTENQYSKSIPVSFTYQYPRAKGKYIALCEGDDYWIDPYKLQKQVDYMESHPDCTFCFTNGYIEDQAKGGERRDFLPYNARDAVFYEDVSRIYTLDDMYQMSFVPTASCLYPREVFLKAKEYLSTACPTGDLRIRLYMTSYGYAYYLNDKTCVYRQNVPNSAMTGWKKYDRKKVRAHTKKIIDMISRLDEITEYKYSDGLYKINRDFVKNYLLSAQSIGILKDPLCKKVFDEFSIRQKAKFFVKLMTPDWVLNTKKKIKKRSV